MTYNNDKQFYARFILLPTMIVMAFVFYCGKDLIIHKSAMAETIEVTMDTAIETPENNDMLAFIPATKPAQTFDIASSKF